ncbi:ubiquitin-conjugating enzyme [Meira miltonrushii]|uniref:Ubiquitin-conjugating enzyme n=1 Tax=Meira miltonrushii TaxID=1280837 RepID=A0A316VCU3_9BASI|nr:ubiquitin-conjugating enzyme [Meira miltonrushii]PWN35300.1 ubiquitin-conjugating enzyme [Meira miltonrushii]
MATRSTKPEGEASATTLRRLMKEYQTEQKIQDQQSASSGSGSGNAKATSAAASRDENILYLAPKDTEGTQLLEWQATIRGPPGGSYEGGIFDLVITVPASYPTKPPSMRFVTRLWHPNVSWKTGEICLDVLSSQWSPAWNLSSALTAVIALLDAPEPDSPLNVDAATVFRTGDPLAYKSMCRMYTLLWASGPAA